MSKETTEDYPKFEELNGKYVQMTDRLESVHVWCEYLAIKNRGRWTPKEITLEKYTELKEIE